MSETTNISPTETSNEPQRRGFVEQLGAGLIEHSLIIVLISLISISSMRVVGYRAFCTFHNVRSQMGATGTVPALGIPATIRDTTGCGAAGSGR